MKVCGGGPGQDHYWAAGRASGLQKQSGEVLAWLSLWSRVPTTL